MTELMREQEQQARNRSDRIGTLLFSVFFCIAGFWIGWKLLGLVSQGYLARWHPFRSLPEKPLSFAGARMNRLSGADIYIETVSGKIYGRQVFVQPAEQTGWEPASLPDVLHDFKCIHLHGEYEEPFFARLHLPIRDCLQIPWSREWVADNTFIVILEDDSLWQLHQRWTNLPFLACFVAVRFSAPAWAGGYTG
jgi:hypothetical protein